MSADLKYILTADIKNLEAGLLKAKADLKLLASEGDKAGRSMAGGLTKGTNSASFALQNFGRVAQDAPFGLMGITNNINPLLESFQRLQKETGSAGGALKAMASGLMGPAGLGIAVSLVSAALLIYQNGIMGFGKKTKEAKEAVDEFNKSVSESYGEEAGKLQVLRAEIESSLVPMKSRLQAIKDIKKEYPDYFAGLTNEQLLTGNVADAYDLAAKAILRKARASAAAAEIERIEAQKNAIKIRNAIAQEKTMADLRNAKPSSGVVAGGSFGGNQVLTTSLKEAKEIIKAKYEVLRQGDQAEIDELNRKEAELLKIAIEGGKETIKIDKAKAASKKQTISDVIAELERELDFLSAKGLALGTNETKSKMSAVLSTIEKLIKDFKLAPDDSIIKKLLGDTTQDLFGPVLGKLLTNVDSLSLRDQLKEKIELATKQAPANITVPINPNIVIPNTSLGKMAKDLTAGIENVFNSTAENVASTFGETIGNALANGTTFEGFFKGMFKALATGVKQLGQFLIQTGIQIEIAKKLLLKSPVAGIAAGIALVALGSLLEAKLSAPGFANGVKNFSGGMAWVGERGPELVNLPRGADVIPNHAIGGLTGSGLTVLVEGEFVSRGVEMVATIQKTGQMLSRQG